MGILEKIKLLKGIEGSTADPVLCVMIADAESAIKAYCHIRAVPEDLEYIVRELVLAAYERDTGDNVASIKRGDTQINYSTTIMADGFTSKQQKALNGYRKLRIG